jgi:hypothetical protein
MNEEQAKLRAKVVIGIIAILALFPLFIAISMWLVWLAPQGASF